jgi:phosphodiesterase/alkaline phosphatase D-like protein
MDRRRFLQYGTAAGMSVAVAGGPLAAWARQLAPPRSVATGSAYVPVAQFPSGVLSGDPTSDGVVLWTRIDPVTAGSGVDVAWEVATDPGFGPGTVLASGTETTAAASDHTVRVEVDGLGPSAVAWYRFTVAGTTSPVGRTKTMPDGPVERVRLAWFSCERYVHGFYTAHADLAERALDPATDVDLVVSLGDYVYEAGPADGVTVPGRDDPDAEQLTLEDFRRQYHRYRSDVDLQAMHAAYPFVGVFDNHDGPSSPSDASGPGSIAAFFEQMPVRRFAGDPQRQHRSVRLGDLAELFVLDERQFRDPTPSEASGNALGTSTLDQPEMVEPGRTMLGAEQLAWLRDGLASSTAAWKVVGSQLMFGPLRSQRFADDIAAAGDGPQRNAGRYVNTTQWDGYQAERRAIIDHVHAEGIADVVALAGDTHFWTTSEVPLDYDDPDAPLVLVEFGGSSITSANAGEMAGLPGNDVIRPVVTEANPYTLRYIEVTTHGYGLLELTDAAATATYRSPASTATPTSTSADLARFEVARGTATVRQVAGDGFLPRPTEDPSTPTTTVPGGAGPAPGPAAPATPVSGQAGYTG